MKRISNGSSSPSFPKKIGSLGVKPLPTPICSTFLLALTKMLSVAYGNPSTSAEITTLPLPLTVALPCALISTIFGSELVHKTLPAILSLIAESNLNVSPTNTSNSSIEVAFFKISTSILSCTITTC